jgi:hypothetical protein
MAFFAFVFLGIGAQDLFHQTVTNHILFIQFDVSDAVDVP